MPYALAVSAAKVTLVAGVSPPMAQALVFLAYSPLVTVITYSMTGTSATPSSVITTRTSFAPSFHVAAVPLVCSSSFKYTFTPQPAAGVAVMVLVALLVLTSYSNTPASNTGVSVSAPIVSPDRRALKGPG